ncbi:PH domain-containing protein [Deinococcus kurensis]|uniref:PH domain-containing protein n=1 Tax=Deinococcus kurensis TaxID=2662757 RepID=UPI001391E57B|nr:PH domain-containing protein [Deinococcus kurensis]
MATISAATLLPLLLLLPLLVFFARRPRLVYEWEPDALIVRTGLSRTGTTRAELTEEGLGLRLFGAAVPGYFTGTFSVKSAGGGRVQAYATSARPGRALLLHLDSTTYYLTPVNPQAALQQFHVH